MVSAGASSSVGRDFSQGPRKFERPERFERLPDQRPFKARPTAPAASPVVVPRPVTPPINNIPRPAQPEQPKRQVDERQDRQERQNKETELRKAMSLDYLKSKPEPVMTKKTPSPQNIADLRSALMGVLKDNPVKKEAPAVQPASEAPKQPIAQQPQREAIKESPKEVPEEVLRKLLHVDSDQTNEAKE